MSLVEFNTPEWSKKELVRRTRLILKSEFNSKNRITATNKVAILVITYSFNVIDWNFSDVIRLGIKLRKMMTTHSMHHPKTDIHRLYLWRSNEGGVWPNANCLTKHRRLVPFDTWIYQTAECYN